MPGMFCYLFLLAFCQVTHVWINSFFLTFQTLSAKGTKYTKDMIGVKNFHE